MFEKQLTEAALTASREKERMRELVRAAVVLNRVHASG